MTVGHNPNARDLMSPSPPADLTRTDPTRADPVRTDPTKTDPDLAPPAEHRGAAPAKPYSPGLEGVIAGESAICAVDNDAGLTYRGYDVHELAGGASFEEVAYLLLHGELPTAFERQRFSDQLRAAYTLPEPVLKMLRVLPPGTHPMDMLRTGISMLGSFDPEEADHSPEANLRKSVRILGRLLTLTTSGYRLLHGQEPLTARQDLSHGGNLLYTLTGLDPLDWETRAMDVLLIVYAEHEFNASTFAARVTASTMASIYAAVTSAMGTLKGPLHGGANEEAMKMLAEVGSGECAEDWCAPRLAKKQKIMGFGHRVYKRGDSRVPILRELARTIGRRVGQEHWVDICEGLERVMERQKKLYANADLYAAPIFHMMQVPVDLNTPIFACSRASGWCAHVCEQHAHNRLIRPRCLYTGIAPRKRAQTMTSPEDE